MLFRSPYFPSPAPLSVLISPSRGPQGLPHLLGGLSAPGKPVVVGVDPQRHVHRAVPGQVLNFLDVQARLEQPGNIGVPKNVRRNVGVRQLPLDQLPHASIRGFRQRLVVLHGNHILGMGSLLPRRQPELQFLRERYLTSDLSAAEEDRTTTG